MRAPGSRLLMLTRTGAPAARAFALGFHEPTKGTAAPTTPTAPTTVVAPVKKRRRPSLTPSLLMTFSPQKHKVERICLTCPLTFSIAASGAYFRRARKSTGHKMVRYGTEHSQP